jgi:hypothetical protein
VGEAIRITAGPPEETGVHTGISAVFQHADPGNIDEIHILKHDFVNRLLRRTNKMLRWYRSVRRRADIMELTRAQACPFSFEIIGAAADPTWTTPVEYEESGPVPIAMTVEQITAQVGAGLVSGQDPSVDALFLLDAERALQQGRFRESVLFCWSTIDSVFNRKYDELVNVRLAGEWPESRRDFSANDFGLKLKMSACMHLFVNRSLYREPYELWGRLSASYTKRNHIIHRGENATEDEARQAIDVARRIVTIMGEIAVPAAGA